jgi:glycopeptide antibiotics resistance protein
MQPFNLESATRFLALVSVTAGILLVTLFPAHAGLFGVRQGTAPLSGTVFLANIHYADCVDVLQNIMLFLPFGFLFATFVPAGRRFRRQAWTCLAGLCLSVCVEILQTWIPGRFPSLSDVLHTGLGAFSGGMIAARLARNGSAPMRR